MGGSEKFPVFESAFLADIVAALNKRRKAIKHKTTAYNLQKVIERIDGVSFEKLEAEFLLARRISVRLHLWNDRQVWLDVRESTKQGWAFEWQSEGRIGLSEGEVIVEAIKDTFVPAFEHDSTKLEKAWGRIIHKGPSCKKMAP